MQGSAANNKHEAPSSTSTSKARSMSGASGSQSTQQHSIKGPSSTTSSPGRSAGNARPRSSSRQHTTSQAEAPRHSRAGEHSASADQVLGGAAHLSTSAKARAAVSGPGRLPQRRASHDSGQPQPRLATAGASSSHLPAWQQATLAPHHAQQIFSSVHGPPRTQMNGSVGTSVPVAAMSSRSTSGGARGGASSRSVSGGSNSGAASSYSPGSIAYPQTPPSFATETSSGFGAGDATLNPALSGPFGSTPLHYSGRAASLPGGSNGRSQASTSGFHQMNGMAGSDAGGAGSHTGLGLGGLGSSTAGSGSSAAAALAVLAQQNGQLAQQLAVMGGYLQNQNAAAAMQQAYAQQWNAAQQLSYERHTAELTNCIIAFLSPILPTEEEYRIKEATRRQLERLAGKVSPGAKLLAFGSMANGFALKNSDMDLCCLIGKDENGKTPEFNASELVETLGNLIRQETDFTVMPLPKARIPIIKISRPASAELPYEISCDIGFENRLALENTRLLLSYAMVDPPRLRTLVLFLKVWTKRRKLNSPYTGTLSSYGYTLLVLFFLTHVKRPSVLPNLQRIPPPRVLTQEEIELNGHNIYFYDDVATLRQEWASQNTENVGELLMDFFRYFSKEFAYSRDVISLRTEGGLVPKDGDAWSAELCIEDPFQVGYNVSRTVTKDGLYTIRGEFMRATRILTSKQGRVSVALAELCEEREDIISRAPDLPYRPRQGSYYAHGSAIPTGVDARTMRELYQAQRRHDAPIAGAFGGSFAFEEMARGLGQGQSQRGAMARPTAAMLAPLSQSGGLSQQRLQRPGRGTWRYGPPSKSSGTDQTTSHISSARSEDGTGPSSYEPRNFARVSARTSPTYRHNTISHTSGLLGEAQMLGSEASMQRMPPISQAETGHLLAPEVPEGAGTRSHRTNSEGQGLNRSMSLPRGGQPDPVPMPMPASIMQRGAQLPLRSEPGSPSRLGRSPYGDFDALAAINDISLDSGVRAESRSTSGCSTGGRPSPMLASSSDAGGPYRSHPPWTFLQPPIGTGRVPEHHAAFEDDSAASARSYSVDPLDDGDASSSISEGTLDELARISALESGAASPRLMAPSAENRIRSWARTSSTPRRPIGDGSDLPVVAPDIDDEQAGDETLQPANDTEDLEFGADHNSADDLATPTTRAPAGRPTSPARPHEPVRK